MLGRNPGFTTVAVLTLALGIGANTAMFSVVNTVLLRPLPFENPERIVQVLTRIDDPRRGRDTKEPMHTLCLLDFDQIRKRNHVFDQMAAVEATQFVEYREEEPRKILGARVSAEFFPLLGVQTAWGRGFRPEEEQPGRDQVVILGYQYWKERYGEDPAIIGQNVTFQEGTYTVIGILPGHLHFLEYGEMSRVFSWMAEEWGFHDVSVWTPLALAPEVVGPRSMNSFNHAVIARLRPEITVAQAQAELAVLNSQLAQEYPRGIKRTLLPVAVPNQASAKVRPVLWLLLGTVTFVLLIACANVANMLLARSLGRQGEIAIRAALGAGHFRLIRQFLTESLLLSVTGGFVAVLLAGWSLSLVRASLLSKMPRLSEIRPDGSVLCFALAISVLTGVVIGLVPVLRLPEVGLGRALKEGRPRYGALHRILLVSEIALALMLLVGAGLMVKSFWRLTTVDVGFDPANVLTVGAKYDMVLKERMERLPEVEKAAFGEPCIWRGGHEGKFDIVGQDLSVDGRYPEGQFVKISEDYFAVLGIPLLVGRVFTREDHAEADRVAIINQTIARRYFPHSSPIGQTLICKDVGRSFRVVGVAGDVRPNGFRSEVVPTIYLPFVQVDWYSLNNNLFVRAAGAPEAAFTALRREFVAMNPLAVPPPIRTLDELLAGPVRPLRSNMQLISTFAALALILASVGVYGLMAFFVSQRTREIGIRMALGARRADVLKSVIRQGLRLTLIGTGLGLIGALALTRVIASFLYDVSPADPLTFAFVSLVLLAVAALASYLPARRAARVDPMAALRCE